MFSAVRKIGKNRARRGAGGALALACALVAHPVLAAGTDTVTSVNGGMLVRGGAPLPDFHIDFLDDFAASPLALPGSSTGGLAISLSSPGQGVLHMIFSPRPQFGVSLDKATGTSRSFAGVAWNVFEFSGLTGDLGLAGSMTQGGADDPNRRLWGPPLALHSTLEFGYHFDSQNSVSLSVDHATTPDFLNDHGGDFNNIRLRYGLHF